MARVNEELALLDIRGPEAVEIRTDSTGTKLWVNVDGICRLRICDIDPNTLVISDEFEDLFPENRE